MAYAVDQLQCGDVLAMTRHSPVLTPDGMLDAGITVSTVNPFDHTAIVVQQDGQLVIVEALWHVTISPLDKYTADGWILRPRLTATQQAQVSAAALSKVGQRYGLRAVAEDFIRDDLHIDIHPLIDPKHMDCSELVCWSLLQGGYRVTYAPDPSPADVSYSVAFDGPRPWTQQ